MEKRNLKNLAFGIGMGTVAAMLILLIGSVILTWMIAIEKIQYDDMNIWEMVLQAAACAASCVVAVLRSKERKLIVSILAASMLLISQLLISMLFAEGAFVSLTSRLIINLLIGAGVGLLSNKTKKRKGFPMKK